MRCPRGLEGTRTNRDGNYQPNRVLIGTSSSNTKWDPKKASRSVAIGLLQFYMILCTHFEFGSYLVIGPSSVGLAVCLVMKLSGNLRSAGRESLLLISSWFYKVIDSDKACTGNNNNNNNDNNSF